MSDIAIRVENLGKKYRLGLTHKRGTLRETLHGLGRRLFGRNGKLSSPDTCHLAPSSDFWALRDVSFEVKRGEVLGIIGRNGAGKSTLLKVLSQVTRPTNGRAEIRGRVGSLLEVGTGFHPELTGRENIYLNGAILGMTKREIDRKFDEIVDFAGVETFLDTPVKRYSSGMHVRLGFSVAAHLEPEILIVDEVLAVGDYAFQRKCFDQMGKVSRDGRTILLVSHTMPTVINLCSRAVLLELGRVVHTGNAKEVVSTYMTKARRDGGEIAWPDTQTAPGNDRVRLHAVRIVCDGAVTSDVEIHKEMHIQVEFWNLTPNSRLTTSIQLKDSLGVLVLASGNLPSASIGVDPWFEKCFPKGLFRAVCRIPGDLLNSGAYSVNVVLLSNVTQWEAHCDDAVSFFVHDTGSMRKEYAGQWLGCVRPRLPWKTEQLAAPSIE